MHACLVTKSCPTLCNPMNYSPPGSLVHGIFQARILEWVAISFSRGSSQPRDRTHSSCTFCSADELFTSEPPGKPGGKLSKRHKSTGKQLNTQYYKDPTIRSLVIYPSKMKTYTKMFTRALLLIIKTWKFKCVSTGEWINCGTTNVTVFKIKSNKLLIYTTP